MKWFLYVFSCLWIAMGAAFILYTSDCRNMTRRMLEAADQHLLAGIPAVIGFLLLFSATSSRHAWVIVLLGLVAIAKSAFIFFNPAGAYDKVKTWYIDAATDQTYRFFGILALILGTAILSWIY